MLVLTRKSGERIVIGSNIVVTVVEIRGDCVKLAFDAPRAVSIHRDEVYRRILAEGRRQHRAAAGQRVGI
jgi:carbon storage regulator